jgi:hypothetical protein
VLVPFLACPGGRQWSCFFAKPGGHVRPGAPIAAVLLRVPAGEVAVEVPVPVPLAMLILVVLLAELPLSEPLVLALPLLLSLVVPERVPMCDVVEDVWAMAPVANRPARRMLRTFLMTSTPFKDAKSATKGWLAVALRAVGKH